MTDTAHRDQSLDTIRGLAILLVIIGHYLKFAPYTAAGVKAGDLVTDFGHGGVILFFLLSGYLIWVKGQEQGPGIFLLRRFAKIFPAYWVNVAFVFAAGLAISFFPGFGWRDFLGNLPMLQGSFGIVPLSGVYWTLIVEVKFYLLFAIVFFTPLRRLFWLVPIAVAAANLGLAAVFGRGSTFLTYLPIFFVGAAIAASTRGKAPAWLIGALAAAAMANLAGAAAFRGPQAAAFLAVDAAVFLLIHRLAWSQRHLAWLGVISYSVYLYHTTLGYPLLERFGPAFGSGWIVLALGVSALVLAVSWLSFREVETRFVWLGRRLDGLFGQIRAR
jgi:peptidoglycan/LPS O-acetylase OafA/YrhL